MSRILKSIVILYLVNTTLVVEAQSELQQNSEENPLKFTECGKQIDLSEFTLDQVKQGLVSGSISSPNFNIAYLDSLTTGNEVKYGINEDISIWQYPDFSECLWTIKSPDETLIKIDIDFIDVEGHTPECYFDQLEFYNNKFHESEITEKSSIILSGHIMDTVANEEEEDDMMNEQGDMGSYCGSLESKQNFTFIYSNNNFIQILFKSDSSERGFGFHLKYSVIPQTEIYPDEPIKSLNCTFDAGLSHCHGWKVQIPRVDYEAAKSFRWKLTHGKPLTRMAGPYQEHTNMPGFRGFYLHADASFPAIEGTQTSITSPPITLENRQNCLEFWVYFQKEAVRDANRMLFLRNNFDLKEYNTAMQQSLNEHTDKDWNGWKLVKIQLEEEPNYKFQLNMTAMHLGKSYYDIGIDDVSIYPGKCLYFDYECRPKYSAGHYIYPSVGKVTCDNEDNYRSVCNINCKVGYHNFGGSPITCERSGWASVTNNKLIWPPPYCDFLECQKFDYDKKIFEVECSRDFNFRSECAFECKSGFDLVGSQLSTCHSNYTWGPDLPKCKGQESDFEHSVTFTNRTKASSWFKNKYKDEARKKQLNLAMDPNFDPEKLAADAKKNSANNAPPKLEDLAPRNTPKLTPFKTLSGGSSADLPKNFVANDQEPEVKMYEKSSPSTPSMEINTFANTNTQANNIFSHNDQNSNSNDQINQRNDMINDLNNNNNNAISPADYEVTGDSDDSASIWNMDASEIDDLFSDLASDSSETNDVSYTDSSVRDETLDAAENDSLESNATNFGQEGSESQESSGSSVTFSVLLISLLFIH